MLKGASFVPRLVQQSLRFGQVRSLALFICLFAVFTACNKDRERVPHQVLDLGTEVWINDILPLDDTTLIACGGFRMEEGWIFKSTDSGSSWTPTKLESPRTATALFQDEDDQLWCGGDMLFMHVSTDDGEAWEFSWLAAQQPEHEEDRPQVRDFTGDNAHQLWFVGGENLNEGVIYRTWDGGQNWDFEQWEYEFRDIAVWGDNVAIAGHGIVLTAEFSGDFEITVIDDFGVGLEFTSGGDLVVISNQGAIYRSTDFGKSFDTILPKRPSKRVYNALTTGPDKFIAVGNEGLISTSEDDGETWNHYQLEEDFNLISASYRNSKIFCGTSAGRVVTFSVP